MIWKVLLMMMLAFPMSVQAATKYVGPSGTAAWADCNSAGTPCSVATGLANAVAGDIVRFNSGTYEPPNALGTFEPSWHPTNDGTAGNPITLISDVQHGAIIHDAADAASLGYPGFGTYNNSYITFSGFSLVKDKATGVLADSLFMVGTNSDHIIIEYFDGLGNEHSYHTNGTILGVYEASSEVTIRYSTFHGMTADPTPAEAVVNASCLYVFEATGVYIYNNTIHTCNNGVSWKTNPSNVHVYNNYLHTIGRAAFFPTIEIAEANGHYIHHNVVRNASRFVDAEEAPGQGGVWRDLWIYNNTVYHSGTMGTIFGSSVSGGLVAGQDGGLQTVRNLRFYNNIMVTGATSRLHEIHDDLTSDGMLGAPFDYNVYYPAAGTQRFIYNELATTIFSTYVAAIDDDLEEQNSSTSNPVFLNASGNLNIETDFKLNPSTSPFLTNGYGGVERGAYEGNPCIGNSTCSVGAQRFSPMFNLRRADSGEIQVVSR
jgi:hypothetical protein